MPEREPCRSRLSPLRDTEWAMSLENAQVVRRFGEGLISAQANDDWQPALAEVDPDVDLDDLDIILDTEHFRGHDAVRRWVGVWNEAWGSWRIEGLEVQPVGEDRAI